jgi:hypothetical protein
LLSAIIFSATMTTNSNNYDNTTICLLTRMQLTSASEGKGKPAWSSEERRTTLSANEGISFRHRPASLLLQTLLDPSSEGAETIKRDKSGLVR